MICKKKISRGRLENSLCTKKSKIIRFNLIKKTSKSIANENKDFDSFSISNSPLKDIKEEFNSGKDYEIKVNL